jgi:hypothetical protein
MHAEAVIPKEELLRLLRELLPLKIQLRAEQEPERFVYLGAPEWIELLPGRGVRLCCDAKIQWSVSVLEVPVMVSSLRLLLHPRLASGAAGQSLEIEIQIEDADVRGVPGYFDRKIVDAANRALAARPLTWDFTRTLTRLIRLPPTLEPERGIDLRVKGGELRITDRGLVLTIAFDAGAPRIDRTAPG